MNRSAMPFLLAGCLLGSSAGHSVDQGRDPEIYLIVDGVTVIDVVSGQQLANHCAAISGHRIRSVAPSACPHADTEISDRRFRA